MDFSEERCFQDLTTNCHLILEPDSSLGAIYLGNQRSVGGFPDKWNYTEKDYSDVLAELKKMGVVAIICCADGTEVFPNDFKYLQFPLRDNPECDISIYFETAFNFLEEQRKKGNVLIHCNAGCSRSPSILISYMMKKLKWKFDEANKFIKNIRSCVNVCNFEKHLRALEI